MEYTIKNYTDSSRNDNPIDGDFVKITYSNGDYEKKTFFSNPISKLDTEEKEIEKNNNNQARYWRDSKLQETDFIVPLTDYPNHADWLTYRQALRNWPSTDSFPDTKPTGSDAISGSLE